MLQRRLFCVALLAAALGRPGPALAREVQETNIDSWQSVVRIADFAFIPPADDNEDVSLTPGFDAVNHAKEGPRKKARERRPVKHITATAVVIQCRYLPFVQPLLPPHARIAAPPHPPASSPP